ncbi:ER degradation-enhancing alpha-mannosidase-like protein 2 [Polyrhizophydium stewartii]|uniref:alpha-1,2-Mannosidase n=1 Tax=Polyrhizophydium stewartii TaxID=2732419 RepID=A0ABR4N2F5_9FUNG
MYYTALEDYIEFAYPKDELKPLSCSGVDTIGKWVMGDRVTFARMVELVQFVNFDQNVNVSVFETNIRVVGGLLSAHLIAIRDPELHQTYDGVLLKMAERVGRKLLVAFDTPTGIPYGTVNLLHGVAKGESKVVCTACAGTFSIEFTWLSLLTGDPAFEMAARRAMRALWDKRSGIGLFGNHINVDDGSWVYPECSIGGGVDSYFEYLFKSHIAFSDEQEYGAMFNEVYRSIKQYMRRGGYHMDVHFQSGEVMSSTQWSLGAFWPSIKVLAGDVVEALEDLFAPAMFLQQYPFLPEMLRLDRPHERMARDGYPLRPEFIESMWYLYRATKRPEILSLAFDMVDRLNYLSRTACGFSNIVSIATLEKEDKMESFFLAETLKYLYLLFDPENEYNKEGYVFNTEAHPFPVYRTHRSPMHPQPTAADQRRLDMLRKYTPARPAASASGQFRGDGADVGMWSLKHEGTGMSHPNQPRVGAKAVGQSVAAHGHHHAGASKDSMSQHSGSTSPTTGITVMGITVMGITVMGTAITGTVIMGMDITGIRRMAITSAIQTTPSHAQILADQPYAKKPLARNCCLAAHSGMGHDVYCSASPRQADHRAPASPAVMPVFRDLLPAGDYDGDATLVGDAASASTCTPHSSLISVRSQPASVAATDGYASDTTMFRTGLQLDVAAIARREGSARSASIVSAASQRTRGALPPRASVPEASALQPSPAAAPLVPCTPLLKQLDTVMRELTELARQIDKHGGGAAGVQRGRQVVSIAAITEDDGDDEWEDELVLCPLMDTVAIYLDDEPAAEVIPADLSLSW